MTLSRMSLNDDFGRSMNNTLVEQSIKSACDAGLVHLFHESARLATFYRGGEEIWPKPYVVTPQELARAGFYFLQDSDRAECPWCHVILRDWSVGDSAMTEHRKHSEHCVFLTYHEISGNVPANSENVPSFTVTTEEGPRHPRFSDITMRRESFPYYSQRFLQPCDLLAESGFFYTGMDDKVRCFHCDGGLEGWASDDDPWVEHAKWFPQCKYVEHVKGRNFIERNRQGRGELKKPSHLSAAEIKEQTSDRLDTPTVRCVLNMGFEKEVVRVVIEKHFSETGDDFASASKLLEAVQAHEKIPSRNSSTKEETVQAHEECAPLTESSTKSVPLAECTKKPVSLEDELQQIKQKTECKICYENSVSVVFLPCKHMVTCQECSTRVKECPICRQSINQRVHAYIS